jgi:hypothetical protein
MEDNGSVCKISVDGTDFKIYEPTPFSSKWWSHKFNGPGLRYEIGVCIQTGWIVWVNGPFPCGSFPDLKIAKQNLFHELDRGEKVICDRGYKLGGRYVDFPRYRRGSVLARLPINRMKTKVRARHETCNKRLKQFGVLEKRFRHRLELHSTYFNAVTNITQIAIQRGEPLFQVFYDDNRY